MKSNRRMHRAQVQGMLLSLASGSATTQQIAHRLRIGVPATRQLLPALELEGTVVRIPGRAHGDDLWRLPGIRAR